ncbi:hypothetical protein [Rhodococcus oryzae]|uniref:hypothetical protein n=1 Tax=Rhodococcus oryzae TaxID=2571143 RepID=UPI003792E6A2
MSLSSTPTRRLAAVTTAAALLAAGLLTGTANAETTGSVVGSLDLTNLDPFGSGSTGYEPDLQRSDTATVENVTVTREVVGPNVGTTGEKVTFRTTFATAAAPDRLITRIEDERPQYAGLPTAKITYTNADGHRTTEAITTSPTPGSNLVASGPGWPITAAGATVVLEVTYIWTGTMRQGAGGEIQRPGVIADISGLGTQRFSPMKAETSCNPCAGYYSPDLNFGS